MTKTMIIELIYSGGGIVEKEILYQGSTMEEIARNIEIDENNLLEYMQTGDFKGVKAFCFGGFMFHKAGIIAAQMREPDF